MALGYDDSAFGDDTSPQAIARARLSQMQGSGKARVGNALSGGMKGAMTGAQLGSVVPGIGTGLGAIIGGGIGALTGGASSPSKPKQPGQQQSQGDDGESEMDSLHKLYKMLKGDDKGEMKWMPDVLGGKASEMGDFPSVSAAFTPMA